MNIKIALLLSSFTALHCVFGCTQQPTAWAETPRAEAPRAEASSTDGMLTIGSNAPPLNVEHWVTNGDGQFDKITKFEEDKVYVVEFWATWCGPCITSMPHLADLQEKHADDGLQIVSISDEDIQKVEKFLERKVDKDKEDSETYAELCGRYCLTTDPDRSVFSDYMKAAYQNGIPTAFIVGKKGRIEWIGHPMRMDEPLEKVLDGSWDRDEYNEEFSKKQIAQMMDSKVRMASRNESPEAAIALADSYLKDASPSELDRLRQTRLSLVVRHQPTQAIKEWPELTKNADAAQVGQYARLFSFSAAAIKDAEAKSQLLDLVADSCQKAYETADDKSKFSLLLGGSQALATAERYDEAIELLESAKDSAADNYQSYIKRQIESLTKKQAKKQAAEKAKRKAADKETKTDDAKVSGKPEDTDDSK